MSVDAGDTSKTHRGHTLHINDLPVGVLHHVFDFLGPRDLCCVSVTCALWAALNKDAAANQVWKAFYSQVWAPPHLCANSQQCWQSLYGKKRLEVRAYGAKGRLDCLYGHKAGIRSLALLPSCNVLATGSLDKTVKLWNLQAGMPIGTSRQHSGTVRALAMDPYLLVSGSSHEGGVRMWQAATNADDGVPRFDLSQQPVKLRGHTGPITSLCLDDTCLYSGSWDYTARIWWRKGEPSLASTLTFDDWVWSVLPRAQHLLVAAGAGTHVLDIQTGARLRRYSSPSTDAMQICRLEGTRDGRTLLTGTGDGAISLYDLRSKSQDPAAAVWEASSAISCLSWEEPFLAATSLDGSLLLLDLEACVRAGGHKFTRLGANPVQRPRQYPGQGGSAFCVHLCDQWMACGSEELSVRTWDFSACERLQRSAPRRRRAGPKAGAAPPRNVPDPVEEDAGSRLSRSVPTSIGSCLATSPAASSSEGRRSISDRNATTRPTFGTSSKCLLVPGDRGRSEAAGGSWACHRSGGGSPRVTSDPHSAAAPGRALAERGRSSGEPCAVEDAVPSQCVGQTSRCAADGGRPRGRPDMHTMQIVRPRPPSHVGVSSTEPGSPARPPCHAIPVVS